MDFKGDTLTQVIITRIPYASPADPLQRARRRMMSPADYQQRYLYDTYIKLKQGIGRLIRCETDRGRVVILDSRYPLFRDQTSLPGGLAGDGKGKHFSGRERVIPASPVPVLREIQSSFSYHCGNCGEEIPGDTIRCPQCGQPFRASHRVGKRSQDLDR